MPAPFDPAGLIRALAEHRVDYVLVGGLGGVLHGSGLTTSDADIVPNLNADNLARLSVALRSVDARIRSDAEPEGIPFDPHPTVLGSVTVLNLTTRFGDLDLAVHPAGLDDRDALWRDAVEFEVAGERIRVASLADIIRSKRAADRPKDRLSLPILIALADEIEQREGGP